MSGDWKGNCQVLSPEFWIEQWEKSLSGEAGVVSKGYSTAHFWDHVSAIYDNDHDEETQKQLDDLIELLQREGLIYEGARVLDIGCGTGRLAITLAHHGAEVTALDISGVMLDRLRQKLSVELSSRVQTVQASWEDINLKNQNWEHRFDLVIAHMTPAVKNPSTLMKMIEASCHSCYLKAWVEKKRSTVLDDLWKNLMGKDLKDTHAPLFFIINLLFSLGYFPSISFEEITWEQQLSVEDTIAYYVVYFSGIFEETVSNLEEKISEYITGIAVEGTVRETYNGQMGTVIWAV